MRLSNRLFVNLLVGTVKAFVYSGKLEQVYRYTKGYARHASRQA